MADTPQQDRNAGLSRTRVGGRFVTAYAPELAFKIVEHIAEGRTLKDICDNDDGMPARQTFHRWVAATPELRKMYSAAREMSAYAMEEEALDLGRSIRKNPGTAQRVRAHEVSMNQLRWSAGKRNAGVFSEKAVATLVVPIQINTTLDMGGEATDSLGTAEHPNIYEIEATVEHEGQPEKPLIDLRAGVPSLPPDPKRERMDKLAADQPTFAERRRKAQREAREMKKPAKGAVTRHV